MSAESASDADPSPRAALLEALEARRLARLALALGAVLAVGVTLLFVGGLAGGRTDEPAWFYLALAFVVFVTGGILAGTVLLTRRVLRLGVHPAALVRRTATGGLLAGGLWALAAVGLALGSGQQWVPLVDVALPWAALLTPVGCWAVYTRYKRIARLRPLATVATLSAVAGSLVLADLAAFELLALLSDVGRDLEPPYVRFYAYAAIALVGGQVVLALLPLDPDTDVRVPAALAVPPLFGLSGFLAFAPGRLALAILAAGLGSSWLTASWQLRRVTDADVPSGPDPF